MHRVALQRWSLIASFHASRKEVLSTLDGSNPKDELVVFFPHNLRGRRLHHHQEYKIQVTDGEHKEQLIYIVIPRKTAL